MLISLKQFEKQNIKNIALLGHASSGKSTLADAMIYASGASDRIGKSADGTLNMDFDPEEKKRGVSVSTAVFPVEWKNTKINLIDAPGLFDFAGGIREALNAADSALIVLSGKSGLTVGAEQAFDLCQKYGRPAAFFISKLDAERAQFYRIISILTGKYGAKICPVFVPRYNGNTVESYVNLINGKGYKFDGVKAVECEAPSDENIEHMRSVMTEAVASVNDELMEKYFSGEAFSEQEITDALKTGFTSGELCPVLCGAGATGAGVEPLLDVFCSVMPSTGDRPIEAEKDGDICELDCDKNGPAVALCFKTIADPFVGKLSYFKVLSGTFRQDSRVVNSRTGAEERFSKVMYIKGGRQEDAECITAGDIGAVAKLSGVLTGDTLCAAGSGYKIEPVPFPEPSYSVAVYPKNKGEEEKISSGLRRLSEEDPSIRIESNAETKETLLSGLGEQHIDVIVSKLKSKFGVDVVLKAPKIAYRETIRKSVKVQGRHKKQSGGHGQFGDVWIEFSPTEEEFVFEEKIFGGSVPKNFHPAVEKGLRECMQKGVLAGYPMVGVKAVLVDGSYHPVDSSEMSFKLAAAEAYKEGIPKAGPALLEPIGTLTASVPDDNLGDVIGDINKRRGRVIGMNPLENHMQQVVAEVPMAEMTDFSTAMRSITQGRGSFTLKFERYEDAPPPVAAKIIEKSKAEQ